MAQVLSWENIGADSSCKPFDGLGRLTVRRELSWRSSSEWLSNCRAKTGGPREMGIRRLWDGFFRILVGNDQKPAKARVRKCCACLTARLISVEMTTFLPACFDLPGLTHQTGLPKPPLAWQHCIRCNTVSTIESYNVDSCFRRPSAWATCRLNRLRQRARVPRLIRLRLRVAAF